MQRRRSPGKDELKMAIVLPWILLIVAACDTGLEAPLGGGTVPRVERVSVVPDTLFLAVGEKDSLRALVLLVEGNDSTLSTTTGVLWSSNDSSVASLSRSFEVAVEVTAEKSGMASIFARSNGKIGQADVVVD